MFVEYDRNRKKEVLKQRREQAERHEIMERAREEREVSDGVRPCQLSAHA